MGLVLLVILSTIMYLLGWLITGQSDAGQWELWFKTLFVILTILWTMRANGRYQARKG